MKRRDAPFCRSSTVPSFSGISFARRLGDGGVNAQTNVSETLRVRCDVGCVADQVGSGLAASQKFLSGAKG